MNKKEEKFISNYLNLRNAFYERQHFYIPGDKVAFFAQISNIITENELCLILPALYKRHPLLKAHMVFNEKKDAWISTEGTPEIPIITLKRKDDNTWKELLRDQNAIPVSLKTGPLVQIFILPTEKSTELVVFAHHMLVDGMSMAFLARDILTLLAMPQKTLEPCPAPSFDTVVDFENIKHSVIFNFCLRKLKEFWSKNQVEISDEEFLSLHSYYKDYPMTFIDWEIGPDITKNLLIKARQYNVSVNSTLYSAILRAQAELQGTKELFRQNIMLPVNIRNHIQPPLGDVFGLYASGDVMKVNISIERPFWKETQKIHQKLYKSINALSYFKPIKQFFIVPQTLIDAVIFTAFGTFLDKKPAIHNKLMQIY